jgi:hypothetical protein
MLVPVTGPFSLPPFLFFVINRIALSNKGEIMSSGLGPQSYPEFCHRELDHV